MRLFLPVYIILVLSLFSGGCRNNDDEEQRLTWSTDAPFSIPYRVRFQRFERGNLIRNHSFETGKIFKLDSANTSFSIDGWQQVGLNVEWTDVRNDSVFKIDEAFSGYRAVKISRSKANETDAKGDGVLSDFIKVIPGNYHLSLYARLEKVMPLRARLGTRMFDAVEVNIQFYDRNKNLMNPAYNFPMAGQVINTSFKGLSFANFKSISSFGWARITGKSHSFPFPEGDIPSDADFVKIFIGLKGTGTLWVDSISFKYTSRNFSISERMQIFTDSSFHTPEALIPNPKKISRLESVNFYKPGISAEELPAIIVPPGDEEAMLAAELIQDAFMSNMKGYNPPLPDNIIIPILNDGNNLKNTGMIISVGNTSAHKKYISSLPYNEIADHKDGYFIYSPPEVPGLVILGANNGSGLYYAALTTLQMIDSQTPVFHNNRIIDYPDFPQRYFTLYPENTVKGQLKNFVDQLRAYKFNGALILNNSAGYNDTALELKDENFMVKNVSGYRPPADSSLTYDYPVSGNIESPDADGLYIPPVFHNEMFDNSDYSEACSQLSSQAKSLYSGSSFFSLNTDAADIVRYSYELGTKPVFMDNSMMVQTEWGHFGGNSRYYPGKLRLYNVFEPFLNSDISEFFNLLDTSLFVVNLPYKSEVSIIRLATAADFLWNSASYTPDFALWKVLLTRYGVRNARDLITFADKYSIILEALSRIELKSQVARNQRIAQQTLVDLTAVLAAISSRLGSQHNLVKELQLINSNLRSKLGSLQPSARK